jgi:amino acid adenylation domain-containing protein
MPKIETTAPTPAAPITLFDIAIADAAARGSGSRDANAEHARIRLVRHIPQTVAVRCESLAESIRSGHDLPYLAAWLLARDSALGNDEFACSVSQKGIEPAMHAFVSLPRQGTLAAGEFLRALELALAASTPAKSSDAHLADCVWCGDEDVSLLTATADTPLCVGISRDPASANINNMWADFDGNVFDRVTVGALLDSALHAATSIANNPTMHLDAVDLLSTDARHALMTAFARGSHSPKHSQTVHARFREMVTLHPKRNALVWREGNTTASLTYAELDAQSEQAQQNLFDHGVKQGQVIGVALERTPQTIITILGIIKCGGAYLPIDLKYPQDRIDFMCRDADVHHVIVSEADARKLPSTVTPIHVDDLLRKRERTSRQMTKDDTSASDTSLAYVMYTSGSTGAPKGIEIQHSAIMRLVCDVEYVSLSPETVMLHAAPLGFDASTLEIWGPLLNGGSCVLHSEVVPTGAGLATTIRAHSVTTAWLTAALFNAVVDEDAKQLRGLHELLTGGEALSVAHVTRALNALPDVTLINGYGPTECTTFTATYRIPRDTTATARSIPIGRPIAETDVYVVNQRLEPVPVGVVGELLVAGRGLARGYLRQPALNASRFVNSAAIGHEIRLYRTGDLVRFLADGNIEFVGRRDGQVKIRGYRIEVGEIEVALAKHEQVRACAVLARKDLGAEHRLVGYIVASSPELSASRLRAHLAKLLPDFMVPSAFVMMEKLPITNNGKVDRRALPRPEVKRPDLANPYLAPQSETEKHVSEVFAALVGVDQVGRLDNFFELGASSLLVMRAVSRLREAFPMASSRISAAIIFSDPTAVAIAAIIDNESATGLGASVVAQDGLRKAEHGYAANEPIAIIGMSGRFPGAATVEALWEMLCAGKDGIARFSDAELDESIPEALRRDSNYVMARGVINDVEMFDAAFFGISPREAELMDPQQRLFMELCWECLERAGYVPETCTGPVGVFGGMYNASYFQKHVLQHPEKIQALGEFQVMLANEKDYITTRVANRLNLTGPAVSVHTACSTSLVAIAQAMESLRAGQCGMALAGGVSITCPPRSGYLYQEGAMLSADGLTRTFDAEATGTVFSDGAAVVVLKRLHDALQDGDQVFAVLKGAAINNDGGAKASFTAPSVNGQAAVIEAALRNAGVDPRSISYVEAHGTATPIGDPIEVEALTRAYRRFTGDTGFCRIGSVKSNIGHTVISAGATGVIKTALALANEFLPATIHFTKRNPQLDFASSPFVVSETATTWDRTDQPRRAGVSSFGVGGTNVHAILEEAPQRAPSDAALGPQLIVLSARTPAALAASAARLASHLDAHASSSTNINLADMAFTLQCGRREFAERLCVVANDATAASVALRDKSALQRAEGRVLDKTPDVVFMFPGQGAQYPQMGVALYESEPVFRNALDVCFAALDGVTTFSLKDRLFSKDAESLVATEVTQPAIFAIEYALAQWWMSLGVKPSALIGHSVGEFVAATVAGVMTLQDAIQLVARRGALMQAQPPGGMLAVRAPMAFVQSRLPESLAIAAENSPKLCVVAGPSADLEAFRIALDADKIVSRTLQTSHAFHSPMMDAAVLPFEQSVNTVTLFAPTLPIYSTVTTTLLTAEEARSPKYWSRHLRAPVRFSSALTNLLGAVPGVLLELGPRGTLTTLARQHAATGRTPPTAVPSMADAQDNEVETTRLAAGKLWTVGVPVRLSALDQRVTKHRVLLPTYPFERKRFWLDAKPAAPVEPTGLAAMPDAVSTLTSILLPTVSEEPNMSSPATSSTQDRLAHIISQLRTLFEETSGTDMADANPDAAFVELGLDSLSLTQIAIQVKQTFKVNVTFRQLMEKHRSLATLAGYLDDELPATASIGSPSIGNPNIAVAAIPAIPLSASTSLTQAQMLQMMQASTLQHASGVASTSNGALIQQVIQQQMQLMAQQLAMLQGSSVPTANISPLAASPAVVAAPSPAAESVPSLPNPSTNDTAKLNEASAADESASAPMKYDVKKAFGAIARIYTEASNDLTDRQQMRLDTFMRRYVARTARSKEYTQTHRQHLADPRVVNGFRPALKEIIYQIVIGRSKGSRVWDLDGNEYVDVLNGFGMNMFGWQPPFIVEAVKKQVDAGYEIGPQHPLAGEVAKLVCDVTGHDRAGLCNTGSEAVMGAVRIARTVTGRNLIAIFTGSYHGIFDEVIVRAAKKQRAIPAAPGIMASTSQNVIVLDYGTPESIQILKERADELAAVLVEPVQSRRPDFQPREFLQELRTVTANAGTLLIFDEVVTGFRCHPGGIQALFGIRADLCTYGKVVGGGFPIGVIAGKREFMDALDGGDWRYGDDSIPTVGVTYFAGTFVRHPLALAAAKAVLEHIKARGPSLQSDLTLATTAMVDELNAFCRENGAPVVLKSFSSVWKTFFTEDHPYQDLLFAMMRSRGIHILDNFPCFFTTAHTPADFALIKTAFKESIIELQEAGFIPKRKDARAVLFDASNPPVPGAKIGKDPAGNPAWFVPNPDAPGKYLRLDA